MFQTFEMLEMQRTTFKATKYLDKSWESEMEGGGGKEIEKSNHILDGIFSPLTEAQQCLCSTFVRFQIAQVCNNPKNMTS